LDLNINVSNVPIETFKIEDDDKKLMHQVHCGCDERIDNNPD